MAFLNFEIFWKTDLGLKPFSRGSTNRDVSMNSDQGKYYGIRTKFKLSKYLTVFFSEEELDSESHCMAHKSGVAAGALGAFLTVCIPYETSQMSRILWSFNIIYLVIAIVLLLILCRVRLRPFRWIFAV